MQIDKSKKVVINIDGQIYSTYKYSSGMNTDVYHCPDNDVMIKQYKNKSFLDEIKWCHILSCAPAVVGIDTERNIVIQEFVGEPLTYKNVPDNYKLQIANIKQELIDAGCNGEDIEFCVKDGKIKIVDLGACRDGDKVERRLYDALCDLEKSIIQHSEGKEIT